MSFPGKFCHILPSLALSCTSALGHSQQTEALCMPFLPHAHPSVTGQKVSITYIQVIIFVTISKASTSQSVSWWYVLGVVQRRKASLWSVFSILNVLWSPAVTIPVQYHYTITYFWLLNCFFPYWVLINALKNYSFVQYNRMRFSWMWLWESLWNKLRRELLEGITVHVYTEMR